MRVFVVYCHPSDESFTHDAKESFLKGLSDAGHSFEVSDLYEMDFCSDFDRSQYDRDAYYRRDLPILQDIISEQEKINAADAIVFIYPVFWTEAPAKLVGWFQRVWTFGFAYGENRTMKQLEKALFIVTMGGSLAENIRVQQVEAMKTVMLGDRMCGRAKTAEMIVFDGMSRECRTEETMAHFLETAYNAGKNF